MSDKFTVEKKLIEAIRKFQDGDETAFQAVYDNSIRYINYSIRMSLKDADLLDDILQETYLEVYKNLKSLREPEAFKKWAVVIAHNKIRISERDRYTPKSVRPHQQDILKRTAVQKTLIDTSTDKFQNSPGLKYWADIQNLKTAAAAYAEAGNLTDLKAKICEKSNEADNMRSELNAVGRELKELKEIRHYLLQYKETAPYRQRYNNAKDKEAYAMKHDEPLTLFDCPETS